MRLGCAFPRLPVGGGQHAGVADAAARADVGRDGRRRVLGLFKGPRGLPRARAHPAPRRLGRRGAAGGARRALRDVERRRRAAAAGRRRLGRMAAAGRARRLRRGLPGKLRAPEMVQGAAGPSRLAARADARAGQAPSAARRARSARRFGGVQREAACAGNGHRGPRRLFGAGLPGRGLLVALGYPRHPHLSRRRQTADRRRLDELCRDGLRKRPREQRSCRRGGGGGTLWRRSSHVAALRGGAPRGARRPRLGAAGGLRGRRSGPARRQRGAARFWGCRGAARVRSRLLVRRLELSPRRWRPRHGRRICKSRPRRRGSGRWAVAAARRAAARAAAAPRSLCAVPRGRHCVRADVPPRSARSARVLEQEEPEPFVLRSSALEVSHGRMLMARRAGQRPAVGDGGRAAAATGAKLRREPACPRGG
ncbi:hypothetical protein M885DRAFT_216724 [Pelagophyceae sp. CCMP2097]|nr:hypothetical protein M885DRAFT_216724 [Pelagophyceae sp. CCMP2097]